MQAGHLHDLNPDAAGIIYEVRVYSLEAASLGQVLHAKQIRAAHCLTSVQFSPTSEHLLLAYGRSAFILHMHACSHSLLHSFILSCMRSFAHAYFMLSLHPFFLQPWFLFSSAFFFPTTISVESFDTCLPQNSAQASGFLSLVVKMVIQTSLVNASVLITESEPVDVSCGKVPKKLFT